MTTTEMESTSLSMSDGVTPEMFRQGMTNLAGAVNIVTTPGLNDGVGPAGFTATAVCSVSDSPATLLVCLNRSASVHDVFKHSQYLAINTLREDQQDLSNIFGGKAAMSDRFGHGHWQTLLTGSPVLTDAAVTFDCVITDRKSVATHDVLFCEVLAIKQAAETGALLYHQRGYRQLSAQV